MDVSDESERFFAGEGEHLLVKEGGKTRFFGEEERFRDEDAPLFFTLLGDDGRSVIIFLEDDEGSTFSFSDNDDRFDFDSSGAASRLHCLHHYWTTRGLSFRGLGPFSFRLGHRKLLFLVLRVDSGASRIGEHEMCVVGRNGWYFVAVHPQRCRHLDLTLDDPGRIAEGARHSASTDPVRLVVPM
ncbi:hypothetical protein JG687_00016431 [Phytophthora cactorum]|uniref:Uncharacterized protein n=1 Tax=Phytophthora cactorum TaxID=29920 RepID=A0A8T1TV67_9STRA|nr:hypothetical protein JG687_00016431 [Phytophthora cactorum]